jgi:AcrR family transcriptional regulator
MPGKSAQRVRNPRGRGPRLREEIVAAARRILERSGVEDAVTLRATAREAGVTAPAIYAHFPGRTEMIEAVIGTAFAEFVAAVREPLQGVEEPAQRLRAGCRAYIHYAHEHPATYRILFTRHQPSALPVVAGAAAEFFQDLVDTLAQCGVQDDAHVPDPQSDAIVLWLALHGLAALPPAHPRFPWPEQEDLLDHLLERLADIDPDRSL